MRSHLAKYLCVVLLGGLLAAAPAQAHLVDIRFGEFYGGALHLLTGLQYALMLFGMSLLASLHAPQVARWMLAVVPVGILVGAAAALAMPGQTVSIALTGALALIGLCAAVGKRLPFTVLISIGGLAALLLGYENGLAIGPDGDAGLFLSGLTISALVAVTLIVAVFTHLQSLADWLRIALRAIGSWIAAVSLILLALSVQGPVQAGF